MCGVEAPPGTTGPYALYSGKYGSCSEACPEGHDPQGKPKAPTNVTKTEAPTKPKVTTEAPTTPAGACVTSDYKYGNVEAGTPCTGYYWGKYYSHCKGSGQGGNGWCGVEAPPGTTGKYKSRSGKYGSCSKSCPKGGVPEYVPTTTTAPKPPTTTIITTTTTTQDLNGPCVSNGIAGDTYTRDDVPAGLPCTGWYGGMKQEIFCMGTSKGGRGWCGVEAPPGTEGKFGEKDWAYGGCSLSCPEGGHSICKCAHGVAPTGDACPTHRANLCTSCWSGFEMNEDKTACVRIGES